MTRRELSPIDVYKLLPETNCRECGERNCLAFATKLVNREASLKKCATLLERKNAEAYERLKDLLAPAVREITIGTDKHAVKIGGKLVMYRHEFAYANSTAIAIDMTDEMSENELSQRLHRIEQFSFDYIGQPLKLDMIAVRSTSNDPARFAATVRHITAKTSLPLMLCSLNPQVLKAGLDPARDLRPLLYAATKDNWRAVADLALACGCPLVVSAPGNLSLLKSLTKTLLAYGITELALDPGTNLRGGLSETLNGFTMLRRAACKLGDELSGFPLVGVPMVAWTDKEGHSEDLVRWREAYSACMLMVRYADLLILHNVEGWALLPLVLLRQNLYTDPRRPVSVKAGLREFGKPNENSPVMFTTNFALTYHTVASDIEKADLNVYLLVIDTEGIAVDSAVAGRKLTAEKITEALKASRIADKVKHRKLVIPGKASRLSSEIEELSGWQVLIGPKDSSAIPKFLQEKWQTHQQS